MLRKSAECVIQKHKQRQVRSKTINSHSATVGRDIYDGRKPIIRAEFVNFCDAKENPKIESRQLSKKESLKKKEMQKMEKIDEEERKRRAEELLQKDREERNRSKSLGRRCRVLPNDRFVLQQLILKEVFDDVYSDFFQG